MGAPRNLTRKRFEAILARQSPPRFGIGYEPAIKATREEAPSVSRPAEVWSKLLQRPVHTLSDPERAVLAVVLYNPALFELHEQRMLPIFPNDPHPLAGHPLAEGMDLPRFRGTLTVANEVDALRFHPVVPVDREDADDDDAKGEMEPACWIGDFLPFLRDSVRPYCVNLNIKPTREAFSRPLVGVTPKTDQSRAAAREVARHRVERVLYADVGIRTVEIAADEIEPLIVANLGHLLLWHARPHAFDAGQEVALLDAFRSGIDTGTPPLQIMNALALSMGFERYQMKVWLFQAIWKRKLRVDLTSERLYIDKPLSPERRDVLEIYADWFRRPQP